MMMRRISFALACLWGVAPLGATTLEQLSLDGMIKQSTSIVRGRLNSPRGAMAGTMIYTFYQLQVTETLKGSLSGQTQVAVPGGVAHGLRQVIAGAPEIVPGAEYVLFLWTSRSGITQIIGLSQGLFALQKDASGALVLYRPASNEMMVSSKTGKAVQDQSVTMTLSALKSRIAAAK